MSKIELTPLKYFMNEKVSVVEIQTIGEENTTWLRIASSDSLATTLKLKSSSSEMINGNEINVRSFESGEFRYDEKFGKFQYNGDGNILMRLPVQDLPVDVTKKIGILLTQSN